SLLRPGGGGQLPALDGRRRRGEEGARRRRVVPVLVLRLAALAAVGPLAAGRRGAVPVAPVLPALVLALGLLAAGLLLALVAPLELLLLFLLAPPLLLHLLLLLAPLVLRRARGSLARRRRLLLELLGAEEVDPLPALGAGAVPLLL